MPYTQIQRKNHIREFQRYLQGISYYNPKIPLIIPDGYFGKETATAVRAFQREYGLPETGTVTTETWNKAVTVYKEFTGSVFQLDVFPSSSYVMRLGETGFLVYIIQAMLYDLNRRYDNFPNININGIYDNLTSEAVKSFQNISNITPTGNINNITWNMLVSTVKHIN